MSSKPRKVLSVFSLVMISVIAVDSLRTLPISAEYGFGLIFFYVLAALIFFIPTALVAAELATGWPKTGGIYVWVREAFGKRWGFATIWLQWVYNVVWYPTIMAFTAATLAYLFAPSLANNKVFLLVTILALFWGATIVNCFGIRFSSWISTIGALFGTLIPMAFIIGLGIYWVATGGHLQIQFTSKEFFPPINAPEHWVLFVGILFGLIGMEVSAIHAEEVKNPQRDYPRAMFYAAVIIISTLVFGSLAIAAVVPHKELSMVTGLMQAFTYFFDAYHMHWMIYVVAILIIIGGLGGVATWVIGPTKGLMVASEDGAIPAVFSRVNKHGVPVLILVVQAFIFTALCSLFVLMPSVSSAYWLLTAMTAQLALLVYILMFASAIKLRFSQSDTPRAYRIPGGKLGMLIVAGFGLVTCIGAVGIGFFPPAELNMGSIASYETILCLGIIMLCLMPFFVYRYCYQEWDHTPKSVTD